MGQAAGRFADESDLEKRLQLALGTPGSQGDLLTLGRRQRLGVGGASSP